MNLKDQRNAMLTRIKSFSSLFSSAKWILGKRHIKILYLGAFCQVVISLLDIFFLALVGPLLNEFSRQTTSDNKYSVFGIFDLPNNNIFILIFGIVIVKNVSSLVLQKIMLNSFAVREAEVGTALVKASIFDTSDNQALHSSNILQTFTGSVSSIFGGLFKPIIGATGELATLIAVIVGLFIINTEIAILSICFFTFFGYFMVWYLGRRQQIIGENSFRTTRESLRSFTEIRLMSRDLRFAHKDQEALSILNQLRIRNARLSSSYTFLNMIPRYIVEVVFLAGIGLILLFLLNFQKSQQVLPILALLVAAGYRILPSLNYIVITIGTIRNNVASLQNVDSLGRRFDIRGTDLLFNETINIQEKIRFSGDLHLENVSYQYPGSKKNVIADFNLTVDSGKTLLIQGLSGSGKTTLISLATGLLTPQRGRVYTYDGKQEIPMDRKVSGISYLSQDVPLLDESFAYNIAMTDLLEKDSTRLKDAADKAGILDRILQSPRGFDTQVGENGALLSAGERQRLGITRCLYAQPALLILDEPTANLDSAAENVVWDTLVKVKGQFTILIVSHRVVPESVYDSVLKLPISN
jgi:ABC-type multidrug transport system fused ATPase/permease subunit